MCIYLYSTSLDIDTLSLSLQAQVVHNCKRLCVEFMHYIIESRALRKVSNTHAHLSTYRIVCFS